MVSNEYVLNHLNTSPYWTHFNTYFLSVFSLKFTETDLFMYLLCGLTSGQGSVSFQRNLYVGFQDV